MSLLFGVIGDVHGKFAALDCIFRQHPDIPFWLCVGDVASASGAYPTPRAPLYWIQGNNESFDRIEAFRSGAEAIANLHFIPNGTSVTVDGISVAGLGGTFAPTWYDTPAADLPVKPKDDKRRHFVRDEVEACKALGSADVLLTHEAPKPFWMELPSSTAPSKRWRRDVGKTPIAETADALQPRLHCFGHHHTHASFTRPSTGLRHPALVEGRPGIPTVCVDRVTRSFLLVDAETFAWHLRTTPI